MSENEYKNVILDNQFFISRDENKRYTSICLAADDKGNVPEWFEVAREGKWDDFWKGKWEYTEETLTNFKSNFDNNVLRYADGQIPFNYRHDIGGKAAGWITNFDIRNKLMDNGSTVKSLWMNVSWTPKAKQEIADREWKYASIEDMAEFTDYETHKLTQNVIAGVALTNIPFITELEPAMRLNSKYFKSNTNIKSKKKEDDNMDGTEEIKKLTTENTTLKLSNADLTKKVEEGEGKYKTLSKDFTDHKEKIEEDKAEVQKEEDAVKLVTDAVNVAKKLNASILDNVKESKEYKLAKESPEAFALMLENLQPLDMRQSTRVQTPADKLPGNDAKCLSSEEFRNKALELQKTEAFKGKSYKEAQESLFEDGFSYKD